jgi:hypothetical protein
MFSITAAIKNHPYVNGCKPQVRRSTFACRRPIRLWQLGHHQRFAVGLYEIKNKLSIPPSADFAALQPPPSIPSDLHQPMKSRLVPSISNAEQDLPPLPLFAGAQRSTP